MSGAWSRQDSKPPNTVSKTHHLHFAWNQPRKEARRNYSSFKHSQESVRGGLFWKENLRYLIRLLWIKSRPSPLHHPHPPQELPALPARVPAGPGIDAGTVAGQPSTFFAAGLALLKMSKLAETLRDGEIRAINRNKLLQYPTAVPG